MSSIEFFKKVKDRLSSHITHLLNSIITTSIYPTILKISMISPQLKQDKDSSKIDSFRQINNLCSLEKIIEQYLKEHLEAHLDSNKIILKNHHGSRKNHGTNTAISQISHELNMRYEEGNYTAVV